MDQAALRALTVRSRIRSFQEGTARRRLEHHALIATLDLYKPKAFVPWVSYLFPPELLASRGLTPLIPEVAAATLTGTVFRSRIEDAVGSSALARDLCGYHRAAKAALDTGILPPPSVCLGTTPLCAGKEIFLDSVALEYGVPFRSVDAPLPPDEGPARKEDVAAVAARLREVHDEIGALSGRRADLERAVALSNRASRAWRAIADARTSGRLVLGGRHVFAFGLLGQVLWGTEGGARGFELLLEPRGRRDLEFGDRGSGDGAPAAAGPRPRLLWLHTMPHHDDTLFDLVRRYGGLVVLEEMGRVHLDEVDPRDPFPGLARRLIEHPLWGSATRRARLVVETARAARIDAVIHFNHWGCRQGLGTLPVLRSTLAREGIHFLDLDGDALRHPGEGADDGVGRLESFLEIL